MSAQCTTRIKMEVSQLSAMFYIPQTGHNNQHKHSYEKLTNMMPDGCLHISLENTKLVRNACSIHEFFICQPELLLPIMDRQAYFLSHVYPQN